MLQSSAAKPTATERAQLDATATPPAVTATPQATSSASDPSTDPERGRVIFSAGHNQAPPCSGCHSTAKVGRGFATGPNLLGVADRAAKRIQGLTSEEYLTQSILQPRAFVVPGYRDMMYPNYADVFSAVDVADIVSYLMTLHEDVSVASQ